MKAVLHMQDSKSTSSRLLATTSLRAVRKRLLYMMQQVLEKICEQLQSDAVATNSRLIRSLSDIFYPEEYPPGFLSGGGGEHLPPPPPPPAHHSHTQLYLTLYM